MQGMLVTTPDGGQRCLHGPRLTGKLNIVISFVIDNGRISRMYAVRDPYKLGQLNDEAVIAR
jgi:hypothetical protein